jgi:Skp family chaperone for outer membrane proteins
MGVAGDLFVVRRQRCLCIASSSLRNLTSQDPSANVIVFLQVGTKVSILDLGEVSKMNKAGRVVLSVATLILAGGVLVAQPPAAAPATPPAAAGPSKIMFINFSQVVTGTEEAKQEFGRVESYVEEQNRVNETRTQDLQNRTQQFQEQRRALNPQTEAEMQREIAKMERDLKRYREDIAAEIEAKRNAVFANLGQKLQTVLNEAATQNGYTAILYMDSLAQNGLAGYFDLSNDITQDIINRYNLKYPVTAAGQ